MHEATATQAWRPTIIRDRAGVAGDLDGRPRLRLRWANAAAIVVLLTHTETAARHDAYDVMLTVNGEVAGRPTLTIPRDTSPTAPCGLARYESAWRQAITMVADHIHVAIAEDADDLNAYEASFPGATPPAQRLDTLRIALYALDHEETQAA
jgi:hypothetical protein